MRAYEPEPKEAHINVLTPVFVQFVSGRRGQTRDSSLGSQMFVDIRLRLIHYTWVGKNRKGFSPFLLFFLRTWMDSEVDHYKRNTSPFTFACP